VGKMDLDDALINVKSLVFSVEGLGFRAYLRGQAPLVQGLVLRV
jgi:hypothetical protein